MPIAPNSGSMGNMMTKQGMQGPQGPQGTQKAGPASNQGSAQQNVKSGQASQSGMAANFRGAPVPVSGAPSADMRGVLQELAQIKQMVANLTTLVTDQQRAIEAQRLQQNLHQATQRAMQQTHRKF